MELEVWRLGLRTVLRRPFHQAGRVGGAGAGVWGPFRGAGPVSTRRLRSPGHAFRMLRRGLAPVHGHSV